MKRDSSGAHGLQRHGGARLRPLSPRLAWSESRRSGQALVVGVTILFILLAVGLLFLRSALTHLGFTNVSNERQADLNLAQAGVEFVDHQLMTSPLGADWRPAPRNLNPGGSNPNYPADPLLAALDPDFIYLRPYASDQTGTVTVTYRGQKITKSAAGPTGGFTRLNFGNGRVLVRVTYNPRNAIKYNGVAINLPLASDVNRLRAQVHQRGPWTEYGPTPLSRYLRIESIGRLGDTQPIDNLVPRYADPTVLQDAGLDRPYRVYRVAYKEFGIGDHLLFVTNRNKETGPFNIGNPGIASYYDETPGQVAGDIAGQELAGDIYVNGDARFGGANPTPYLPNAAPPVVPPATGGVYVLDNSEEAHLFDNTPPSDPFGGNYPNPFIGPPVPANQAPAQFPLFGGVNVAGQIVGHQSNLAPGPFSGLYLSTYNNFWPVWPTGAQTAGELITDSLARDNGWFSNNAASPTRTVRRLAAPALDLNHYRNLTPVPPTGPPTTWPGPGLRILNGEQRNTDNPGDWDAPYSQQTSKVTYWKNPGYSFAPLAPHLVFHHPQTLPGDPDPLHYRYYYARIYLVSEKQVLYWRNTPPGIEPSQYLDVYYTPDAITDPAVINASNSYPRVLTDPLTRTTYDAPVAIVADNTIMAEGNISVRGDIAPGMTSSWPGDRSAQLTIVAGGNIYIDGDLARAEQGRSTPQGIDNYNLGTLEAPSGVVLMAAGHVVVNLTRAGVRLQDWNRSQPAFSQPDDDIAADQPDFELPVGASPPTNHWTFDVNGGPGSHPRYFRLDFSLAGVPKNTPVRLYLRHASKQLHQQGPDAPKNTDVEAFLNSTLGLAPASDLVSNWANYRIVKNGAGALPPNEQSITPEVISPDGQTQWEYASYLLNPNQLKYGDDNTIYVEVAAGTYYLSRIEVRPVATLTGANGATGYLNVPEARVDLDAALLADGGSFYMIPKDWFYFNPPPGTVSMRRHPDLPMGTPPVDYSSGAVFGWGIDPSYPGYIPVGGGNATPQSPSTPAPILEQVVLDGSLTVNTMAPEADQEQWAFYDPSPVALGDPNAPVSSQHRWSYPFYYSWYRPGATVPNSTVPTTSGPLFAYNDSLVDLTYRDGNWVPALPGIALTPGLVFEGEGQAI